MSIKEIIEQFPALVIKPPKHKILKFNELKYPKTMVKNEKLELDGEFNFNVFEEKINEQDFVSIWSIEFKISPELVQDLSAYHDDTIEQIAQRLKEGFIKFLKGE